MKILFITNLYPPYVVGGYEMRCKETVEYLTQKGHDVKVLTSIYGCGKLEEEGVYRLLENEWRDGFVEPHWKKQLLEINNDVKALERVLKIEKPELLIIFSMNGLSLQLFCHVVKLDMPKAYDVCDEWVLDYYKESRRVINKFAVDSSNFIKTKIKQQLGEGVKKYVHIDQDQLLSQRMTFISEDLRNRYIKAGLKFKDSRVIYNSVDINLFRPCGVRKNRKDFRLLCVGQVMHHKGVHVIIEALKELEGDQTLPVIHLDIVGGSVDKGYIQKLKDMVDQYGLNNRVHFHGRIPREEIIGFYRNNDVYIFPVIWEEPFAGTLVEAMASGITIISTTTGGSKEIIRDRKNALAFPAGDANALSEKIKELIQDEYLRHKLAEDAREIVVKYFSKEVCYEQSTNFYCESVKYRKESLKQ